MEDLRDEGIRNGHHAATPGVRHTEHATGTKRGARCQEVGAVRGGERRIHPP